MYVRSYECTKFVFVIFRKILQELVASGDLDGDGGLSWEEFEGFGNFEFAANWFG